jgi:hypothetical protein
MHIDERETVIRVGYGPAGMVSVWSTERGVWAKLKRAGWVLVNESKSASGRCVGQEWEGRPSDLSVIYKKPGRAKSRRGFATRPDNIRKGL